MRFAIIVIILALYTALLIKIVFRSQNEIICPNCGHKYIVTPNRIVGYTSLLLAAGLTVGFFVLDHISGFSFSIVLAVRGLYYILKDEGYRCYNCKTINQLP